MQAPAAEGTLQLIRLQWTLSPAKVPLRILVFRCHCQFLGDTHLLTSMRKAQLMGDEGAERAAQVSHQKLRQEGHSHQSHAFDV